MIKLQFTDENTPAQLLIDWLTGSKFSHVDYVTQDGGGLLGARPIGGVDIRPPGYHKFSATYIVELPLTLIEEVTFIDFLNSQLHKPYDWRALLSFFWKREWQRADSWFCSELIAAGLVLSGFLPQNTFKSFVKVSPQDLLLAVQPQANLPVPVLEKLVS